MEGEIRLIDLTDPLAAPFKGKHTMSMQPITEGTVLWEPSKDFKSRATITKYLKWLESQQGLIFNNYDDLWGWSVREIENFWQSLWQFFDIMTSKPYTHVLSDRKMPGAQWFQGAELSYAEHSSNDSCFSGLRQHRGNLVQLFT
jgi:hypothetical protein